MVDASPSIVAAVFLWGIDMNDRELLVLSAKAAGVKVTELDAWFRVDDEKVAKEVGFYWNPITDIDTAMFIALKLNFSIKIKKDEVEVGSVERSKYSVSFCTNNKKGGLLQAITMLAAEIGREMQ